MKTETQIAEENIKWNEDNKENVSYNWYDIICKEHKATCQRWLEFLDNIYCVIPPQEKCPECIEIMPIIDKKIIDLKQAIKLYEDAGI